MILTKRKIKQIKRPTWLVHIKTKTVIQILNEEGINVLENWLDKGNKMEESEKNETRYNINQGFEVLIVQYLSHNTQMFKPLMSGGNKKVTHI